MKRMLLTTTTMSAMLALASPGVASAHRHAERHHHARHASAHHHRHHAVRVTVRHFGSPLPAGSGSATTTTTPPATPPGATGETAGTVASFTGGVLTLTLTNGSTVSGQVTDQTEIHCLSSAAPPTEGEDHHGDDDRGGSESGDRGRGNDRSSGDGRGDQGDDDGGPGAGQNDHSCCTTAALVVGAVVREGELRVSSSGAVWDHIDLIG